MYMKFLFLDLPLLFSSEDMRVFRRRITIEISEGRVFFLRLKAFVVGHKLRHMAPIRKVLNRRYNRLCSEK